LKEQNDYELILNTDDEVFGGYGIIKLEENFIFKCKEEKA